MDFPTYTNFNAKIHINFLLKNPKLISKTTIKKAFRNATQGVP